MAKDAYPDTARVDALDKVRGAPIYAADRNPPGLLHAALAVSTAAKGAVRSIDTTAARAVPGVSLVLTHTDLSTVQPADS